MPTATPTSPTLLDLNTIDRAVSAARTRASELEAREQALALDGLAGDDAARAELASVQAERDRALLAIRDGELAKTEHARRTEQAERDAEAARVERHMKAARELQGPLENAAAEADKYADLLAKALRKFADLDLEQQQELQAAGESGKPDSPPWAPTTALKFHLRANRVPPDMIQLDSTRAQVVPLVQAGLVRRPLGEE
jgi:hypothetical protein